MKFKWLILLCTIHLAACHKVFHYTSTDPSQQKALLPVYKSITIDESYSFYVRQAYETEVNNKKELRTNPPSGLRANSKLIELEYLFLSEKHRNAIYISTMPDKYKRRYHEHYLGDQYVNVWDFKTFLFGTLPVNDQLQFKSWNGRYIENWQFEYENNGSAISITNIIEKPNGVFEQLIPVSEALYEKITLKKVENPLIVFHEKGAMNDTAYLSRNTIYLVKRRIKHRLYFHFDNTVYRKPFSIFFREGRIVFDPRYTIK